MKFRDLKNGDTFCFKQTPKELGRAVKVAREAGFPDELIDRDWPLIYSLAEADLMDDDDRERWIAAGMPLDKTTSRRSPTIHPFPDET